MDEMLDRGERHLKGYIVHEYENGLDPGIFPPIHPGPYLRLLHPNQLEATRRE